MPSFLTFTDAGTSPSGKTRLWHVSSKSGVLGTIHWLGTWRRYVFAPGTRADFDAGCLREIADFCEQRTAEHKAKKNSEVSS